jgi:mannose-6-phosphate isomerase-like protein (cupin superfamily)
VVAHEIPELDPQPRDEQGHGYVDFLASEKLSVGLSVWPAGSIDRQRPHREDEVYYVISGRGTVRVADEDRPVKAGSLVFVAANIEHRFHNIEEDLRVLVFWAPPHNPPRAS